MSGQSEAVVDVDALTVAMVIAPGAYARNRMFAFFKDPQVRRAKRRAALLRGLVRQLSVRGGVDDFELEKAAHGATPGEPGLVKLRYRIARIGLTRRMELTELELACVLHLARRAGAHGIHTDFEESARIHAALKRLLDGFDRPG